VTIGDCCEPFDRNPENIAGQRSEFASGHRFFDARPAATSLRLAAVYHQGDRAPDRQQPAEADVDITGFAMTISCRHYAPRSKPRVRPIDAPARGGATPESNSLGAVGGSRRA